MPLIDLCHYAGVAKYWSAEQEGPECATVINILHQFDAAVLWKYDSAHVRTVAAEDHQNYRVPVWPGAVIKVIRLRRKLLPNDERDNKFWKPLFN